jgi:effector-binding domain-containing protein
VNQDTGYRYYAAGQIPTAQVIRRLRDLEMPVAEVRAVLAAPDAAARNALIAAHLDRLEAELAQTRAAVESLRNLLQPSDGVTPVERRSVPATVFVPVEGRVRPIGRVAPLVVPGAELAIISHHGSLADADLSYAKLGSYATTHEISIDGPLREYYLCGADDTRDEAEWRTDIGWPIFRADAPA